MKLVLAGSRVVVADDVLWAQRLRERVRGLIGRPPLERGRALVIEGARQIHTFGLAYSLDVVFCDADWVVVHVVPTMRPRRITRWVRSAHYVVELPAGSISDEVRIGARLELSHP